MTGGENGGTAAWPGDLRSHREALNGGGRCASMDSPMFILIFGSNGVIFTPERPA